MTEEKETKEEKVTTCSNLEKIGLQWFWNVGDNKNFKFFTNGSGAGLFIINNNNGDITQMLGTCQFNISGMSESGARKKINRIINSEYMC